MLYLLLLSYFAVPLSTHAERPPTPLEVTLATLPHETQETSENIIYLFSRAYAAGKDPIPMVKTIYCESQWYNIQSGITINGVQEESYGLAQIHLPSHPHITKEQALTPEFAIDFMVEHFDEVSWYGYNRETDECNNTIDEYWK